MRIFKYLIYTILLFISIVILYISLSYILATIPKKSSIPSDKKDKKIYILYSDTHSDIVINIRESKYDWQKLLPKLVKYKKGYLAFGWGDLDTYLNTPTWSELKISTALKALFINTPSIMHVAHYRDINRFRYIKNIKVSKAQKDNIERKILESFGKKIVFRAWEDRHSIFYDSPYQYNLVNTCNSWVGNILRESNVTMSYWTPFSSNVINSL